MSVGDVPSARRPTTVPTVTRIPLIHAFPPMTAGSKVIRGNVSMLPFHPRWFYLTNSLWTRDQAQLIAQRTPHDKQ